MGLANLRHALAKRFVQALVVAPPGPNNNIFLLQDNVDLKLRTLPA